MFKNAFFSSCLTVISLREKMSVMFNEFKISFFVMVKTFAQFEKLIAFNSQLIWKIKKWFVETAVKLEKISTISLTLDFFS